MTRFSSLLRVCLLTTLMMVGLALTLHAQTFTSFDVSDTSSTLPTAISEWGHITGFTEPYGSNRSYGFVRDPDGTITTFDVPNVVEEVPGCPTDDWPILFTTATDIGLTGEVVGKYMQYSRTFAPRCTRLRGFIRKRDGTFTTFGGEWWPEGISQESANSVGLATGNVTINDLGQIAGWYGTDNGGLPFVGFLRKRGNITTFGLPDGVPRTFPTAINVLGIITGSYRDGVGSHGFLRKPSGNMITFDVPNSISTHPTGIDWAGSITGYYQDGSSTFRGFLREWNRSIITFDIAGTGETFPVAIDARSNYRILPGQRLCYPRFPEGA